MGRDGLTGNDFHAMVNIRLSRPLQKDRKIYKTENELRKTCATKCHSHSTMMMIMMTAMNGRECWLADGGEGITNLANCIYVASDECQRHTLIKVNENDKPTLEKNEVRQQQPDDND